MSAELFERAEKFRKEANEYATSLHKALMQRDVLSDELATLKAARAIENRAHAREREMLRKALRKNMTEVRRWSNNYDEDAQKALKAGEDALLG